MSKIAISIFDLDQRLKIGEDKPDLDNGKIAKSAILNRQLDLDLTALVLKTNFSFLCRWPIRRPLDPKWVEVTATIF